MLLFVIAFFLHAIFHHPQRQLAIMLRNSKHRATHEPHHPHISHPAHTLHVDSNDSALSLENTPEQMHRKFMPPSPLKMTPFTPTLSAMPGTPLHGLGSESESPMAAPSGKNTARVQPKLGGNIYASNLKMMASVDDAPPGGPMTSTPKKSSS